MGRDSEWRPLCRVNEIRCQPSGKLAPLRRARGMRDVQVRLHDRAEHQTHHGPPVHAAGGDDAQIISGPKLGRAKMRTQVIGSGIQKLAVSPFRLPLG